MMLTLTLSLTPHCIETWSFFQKLEAGVFKKSKNFHSIKLAVSKFQNDHIKTASSKVRSLSWRPREELLHGGQLTWGLQSDASSVKSHTRWTHRCLLNFYLLDVEKHELRPPSQASGCSQVSIWEITARFSILATIGEKKICPQNNVEQLSRTWVLWPRDVGKYSAKGKILCRTGKAAHLRFWDILQERHLLAIF